MYQNSGKPGGRRALVAITLAAAFVVAVVTPGVAQATLTGSSFEGGDGNLVVDTTGNHDWANVPGRNVGIDLPTGKTDNSFGQGTKEDDTNPTVVNGSIPPNKNDLTRFYEASEQAANGDILLYLGWERLVNIGNANLDFEISQKASPTFTSSASGPVTLVRTPGDLLVTYDFSGSGKPTIGINTWVTSLNGTASDCFSSASLPCWGKHKDVSGNSEAAVNTTTVAEPIAGGNLTTGLFGEAAINLTASGVFPAGACEAFGSAFIKSRSSSSFTAELKDFIAPIPVDIQNCGKITVVKKTQNDPAGTQTFSYTTTGGLSPSSFSLKNAGTQVYDKLGKGNYSVTEGAEPTGWDFVSVACVDDTTKADVGTPSGQSVAIALAAGQKVTCTYTNHFTSSPTIKTTLSSSSVEVGSTVHDSSAISGGSSLGVTGKVTYSVYTDDKCTAGKRDAGTKTIVAGAVPDSDGLAFNTVGDFYWQAAYSGDGNNNPATSACTEEHLVVNKAKPSVSTAQDLIPNDSMTITGAFGTPGGTVTFQLFDPSDPTCAGSPVFHQDDVAVSGGSAATSNTTFHATAEGTWNWKAVYTGDDNNEGATSACGVEHFTITNK